MTLDDAIAQIVAKTPLRAQDVVDLLDVAEDSAALETLIRVYRRLGREPDRTGWQTFGEVLAQVEGFAERAGPIVAIAIQIAAFV